VDSLAEEIRRREWDETWGQTRLSVIQRVFVHDGEDAAAAGRR
jgi:hypothetical protein